MDEFAEDARTISKILNFWDFGFFVAALRRYANEPSHKRVQLVLQDYFQEKDFVEESLVDDAEAIKGLFPECSAEEINSFLEEVGNEDNRVRLVARRILKRNSALLKRTHSSDVVSDEVAKKKPKIDLAMDDIIIRPSTDTGKFVLTPEEKILKSEIIWALNCIQNNLSFRSNEDANDIFSIMFSDSEIAKSYKMGSTKCKYVIQFGIAPFIKELLVSDINNVPFTFKFDETTTKQVKKQYDGYVQYFSSTHSRIITAYVGSLFVGHCPASELQKHFFEFVNEYKWDLKFLLHIGMDGPNVNHAFQRELKLELKTTYNTEILDIGTCSLHPVHTAFINGLKTLNFDLESLLYDLHFFFKYSSARRADFKLTSLITELKTENMLKHVNSRWLSLHKVLQRVLDQWDNLREYFLKQLPKEKNFEANVKGTLRYQNISRHLNNSEVSKMYISFAKYVADDLQIFLTKFQSDEPLIHVLYPSFGELLLCIMNKFVKRELLFNDNFPKDAMELGKIKVTDIKNLKDILDVEVGTTVNNCLHKIDKNKNIIIFRKEFRKCYSTIIEYLQRKLPVRNKHLQHLQYLHPKLRHHALSLEAIGRLSISIGNVLKGATKKYFDLPEEYEPDRLSDLLKNQWLMYQTETIGDADEYTTSRIDDYWGKIGKIRDLQGKLKYQPLFSFAKICLSLSHANAAPERGFSINKMILENKDNLKEDTIISLRFVKDALLTYGGITKFPLCKRLFDLVNMSNKSYKSYLLKQQELQLQAEAAAKQKKEGQKSMDDRLAQKRKIDNELETLERKLASARIKLVVAQKMVTDGNDKMASSLLQKSLNKENLTVAHMLISTGMEKSVEIQNKITELEEAVIMINKKHKN